MRRALASLALVVVFLVALAAPAGAHATLESTSPGTDSVLGAAPTEVRLNFSEPVRAVERGVRAFNSAGERTDSGVVRSSDEGRSVVLELSDLSRGTTTVSWRVTSDDGHTISGSWVFHVGAKTGASDIVDEPNDLTAAMSWLGRFLFYGGFVVSIGVTAVGMLRLKVPRSAARLAGAFLVLGAGLVLVGRAAETVGGGPWSGLTALPDLFGVTRATTLDSVRLALSVVLAAARVGQRSQVRKWLVACAAVGLAFVTAVSGHAWVTSPRAVLVGADIVHLLAVSAWLGSLVALVWVLRKDVVAASTGRTFSLMAAWSLAAVGASGVLSSWFQLGEVSTLWQTGYGRLLAGKVAVVIVMAGLGLANRRTIQRLAEQALSATRAMRLEVAGGVCVLILTSFLVATVPGRESASRPFATTVALEQGAVIVDVSPARAGVNELHLNFVDGNGLPVAVDAAELSISRDSIEPLRVPLLPLTPSHYTAAQASFGAPGTWTLALTIVRAGEATTTSVAVIIK